MRRGWRFWLKLAGAILAVLALVASSFGVAATRRPFPRIDGQYHLDGLDGPVDVYRDHMGVPHIYATTTHDLLMAQGFVHAQDRFWQMDFSRHIGAGRLSEMFGEDQVDTDAFIRTLGWQRVATQELEGADPEMRAMLEAYSEGVNAYLADRSPAELSFEYSVLELVNHGYTPEPWDPVDTLVWAKVMSWTLSGNMDSEIARATFGQRMTDSQVDQLYPPYPDTHPFIVTGSAGAVTAADAEFPVVPDVSTDLQVVRARLDGLNSVIAGPGDGIGSNSWVISGSRTATGTPILANDPHLGIQMPSIWYQLGLHCVPRGEVCPFDVAGFSFPGAPGVIIGHNDRIAWGFTNLGPDVMDLYIERVNPDDPGLYEVEGNWVQMDEITEVIEVAGGEPVSLTVRTTRHGPVIDATFEALEDFGAEARIDVPDRYAIAVRWTALEPTRTFEAILAMDLARNWEEFRTAAAGFDVPSQNLVYADVDGNIGYQAPGRIPVRAEGDGRLPVPGWTGRFEWTGFIPFEELPSSFNPPDGYIVTANNKVAEGDHPYLGSDWDYGYRARRIVDLVSALGSATLEDVARIQNDTYNLNAERLVPFLLAVEPSTDLEREALEVLAAWDLRDDRDSAGAAVFEAVWRQLLTEVFLDDIADTEPGGNELFFSSSRFFALVDGLVDQPNDPWWDDVRTAERDDRDAALQLSFVAAVEELAGRLGGEPTAWRWGRIHTATFRNASLGESGVGLIENRFNRGPYETGGGSSIVNAVGWNPPDGFEVSWLPSMRMIVDLGDLQRSLTVHTTGQSGHAYHGHYTDMVEMWRDGEYYPMHWDRAAVEADAEGHLRLLPPAG